MKKTILFSLLLLIMPVICLAQRQGNHQSSDDLKIVSAGWQFGFNLGTQMRSEPAFDSSDNSPAISQRDRMAIQQVIREETIKGNTTVNNGRLDTVNRGQYNPYSTVTPAASVYVQNTGQKTIKSVSYEFFFLNMPDSKELLRYKFREKVKINPGEDKLIRSIVTDQRSRKFMPVGADTQSTSYGKIEYKVVINKIEYTDGSVWKR